jgi:hypothetical protein
MVNLKEIKNSITFEKIIEGHKNDLINFKNNYENCITKKDKYYYMDNFFNFSICSSRYFNETIQEFDDHDYYLTVKIDDNEYKDYYLQNTKFLDKIIKHDFECVMKQLKNIHKN